MDRYAAFIYLVLVTTTYGSNKLIDNDTNKESKSGGGVNVAAAGAFPHHAAIYYNGGFTCSGAIISDRWVLTAASCVVTNVGGDDYFKVFVGSLMNNRSGAEYQCVKRIPHSKYVGMKYFGYDIGLIKVNESIRFNEFVKPISLPTANIVENNYPAVFSAWGIMTKNSENIAPGYLKYAATRLPTNKKCHVLANMPDERLCSDSEGCKGDDGAPLVADGALAGIFSFITLGCRDGYADVFTRVYFHRQWIIDSMANNTL